MTKTKLKIGDHFFDGDRYGLVISARRAVFIETCPSDWIVSMGKPPKSYEIAGLSKPVSLAFKTLKKVLNI